jgi:CheY-like chemotaxis protein
MSQKPLETVVLIDDNAFDNKMHARVIERSDLAKSILIFSMAEDAIAHFRKPGALPPDLILLDINMPRMDGFEMLDASLAEFGEEFTPSVVIMLTTSMDGADRRKADSYEVVKDYFQKPLTQGRFEGLVEQLTAHTQAA